MAEDGIKKSEVEPKSQEGNESPPETVAGAEGEEEESGSKAKEMKPWEQHATIISIQRFDYNAPSALLLRSHSGFLVTCSIKREKSATKEVISILEKYIGSHSGGTLESSKSSTGGQSAKRRKIVNKVCAKGMESKSVSEDAEEMEMVEETSSAVSLVKLTRSGLLLLMLSLENPPDATDIVSNIYQLLESGNLRSPLWCHRIFPIQATCRLDEKDMQTVVSELVTKFMNNKADKLERPIKYAVGYNKRGIEETHAKNVEDASKDSNLCPLLDRNKCFDVVATAVKEVVSESTVDLKSPQLCILVELLPVSGVPNGELIAAVSVLPQNLVNVKPRLCIKPLVSDANAKNGRS